MLADQVVYKYSTSEETRASTLEGVAMTENPTFAKTRISPSDLTFLWGDCRRCFWLKYRHGVSHTGIFPGLVTVLSAKQEGWYEGKTSRDFSTTLPTGVVHSTGLMLHSAPIVVDDRETPFTVGGKYDFLLEYEDGTFGIVDTKIVGKAGDKGDLYWPQLSAYEYLLANPKKGAPRTVSTLGLLVWSVADVHHDGETSPAIGFDIAYQPLAVDPPKFRAFIADVVRVLEGPLPRAGERCNNCAYFDQRGKVGNEA
jgi:hypothetical protein